jgi:hypothetical protein
MLLHGETDLVIFVQVLAASGMVGDGKEEGTGDSIVDWCGEVIKGEEDVQTELY